jgi:hypothetical protein
MMGDEKKKVIKPEDEKARIKEMAREDRYKKIRERDMKLFGPNEELTESDKREALNNALLKAGSKIAGAPAKNMKKGGKVKQMKKGGMVKRGDGCAVRGKTKGRMV